MEEVGLRRFVSKLGRGVSLGDLFSRITYGRTVRLIEIMCFDLIKLIIWSSFNHGTVQSSTSGIGFRAAAFPRNHKYVIIDRHRAISLLPILPLSLNSFWHSSPHTVNHFFLYFLQILYLDPQTVYFGLFLIVNVPVGFGCTFHLFLGILDGICWCFTFWNHKVCFMLFKCLLVQVNLNRDMLILFLIISHSLNIHTRRSEITNRFPRICLGLVQRQNPFNSRLLPTFHKSSDLIRFSMSFLNRFQADERASLKSQ